MHTYNVSKNLDYLTISHDKRLNPHVIGVAVEEIPSVNGNYNKCFLLDTGAVQLFHTERPEMRTHTILSGETLGRIRGNGFSDIEVLEEIDKTISNNITRIDLAITSWRADGGKHQLNAHKVAKLVRDGKCKTRLKASKHVANSELNIETAYIGNRETRHRLFRAYDKGIEQKIMPDYLQRYELETRKNAKGIARAVLAGQDMSAIIRRYVDFPDNKLWLRIMGSEVAKMPHEEEILSIEDKRKIELSKRWQWLIDSAAVTLAKALYADGVPPEDNPNIRLFDEAWIRKYNELLDKP